MASPLAYPKTKGTTVNRYNNRATYDVKTIHSIVNESSVLHVSFAPDAEDPFPAILPMIGTMGSFDYPSADLDEPLDCYLHGYVSSRIMRLATSSPQGLPVSIAATKVDGLVLALTPNANSYNYRSAILHGYASIVEKTEEKLWAMELITNSVVPDRWKNSRVPPDSAEMQSTKILRVKITAASGKVREGGPHDEAKDATREDVTGSTWIGVVPVVEKLCEPIPASQNKVGELPNYITDYVAEMNAKVEAYALNAARLP
ncbi:uncharacterized protein Z519_02682 [Cladophialophora bantiana CBS 173.52]|uniref:Flavin-nucleotide-binding protein n=1 Tax=Cladophialophora bantiana (strain ATCC 10958 / CBS 173.52 / CDC B-1940 / NIH 8579) TaxID=1442370 RepID=A0A0D2I260_CLAB1|nr:uncharacterized protein Z519_02682 [Cladophialophora bantiana CBS 173.52]KIW97290.1 hypothetical protein Z519_02682 [Cladophialophora bantiana CBS 173.52]